MTPTLKAAVVAIGAMLLLAPDTAQSQDATGTFTLETAVAAAFSDNPSIRALRLARRVSEADVRVAGQRPNPDVLYEGARETPHHAFTLALPLETGMKRKRRIASASAVAHTTDAEIALAEADLRSFVRRAFFSLAVAQERVSITRELLAIGERAHQAADARVQAGDAPRLELVQSDLARGRLENDAAAALGALDAARVELNTLLGRLPTEAVAADANLGELVDVDGLLSRLAAVHGQNVEVKLLDRRVDEALARVDLAQAMRIPDPIVQGTLTYKAPPDFTYGWRAAASVTIPMFSRYTATVARNSYALTQATAQRDAGQQMADGRTAAAAARVRALAAQRGRETTTLVPRSLEVERMAEDAYRAGQIDLTALLQTLQTGRDVRLRTLDTTFALQLALADLERAAGVALR